MAVAMLALLSAPVLADRLSVMVVDFTGTTRTENTRRLPELIVDQIVNNGTFDVVEREKLTSVVNEFSLQAGALVDPNRAVEIGNMIGAEIMITGNVIDDRSSRKQAKAYGIVSNITTSYLKARIEAIDLRTGIKLFSHVADDTAELKAIGPNSTGRGYSSMAPRVAQELTETLLTSPRIQEMVREASGDDEGLVSITINSTPKGADVEIDGVFMGNAGSSFEVNPGIHEVKVSLVGHTPWVKQVKVRDGMSFNANLATANEKQAE